MPLGCPLCFSDCLPLPTCSASTPGGWRAVIEHSILCILFSHCPEDVFPTFPAKILWWRGVSFSSAHFWLVPCLSLSQSSWPKGWNMLICIKLIRAQMGVALVPFKHLVVLVFQDAVNGKVWEAGGGCWAANSRRHWSQLYFRMLCSFSSSSSQFPFS